MSKDPQRTRGLSPEDICPRPAAFPPIPTEPLAHPIVLSTVYRCSDPDQAAALLSGDEQGYVYARDGHPNATLLADKCRQLHGAEHALVCGSGMSVLSLCILSLLGPGNHIVVSGGLYGRSMQLLTTEARRWGLASTVVDTCDLEATEAAFTPRTRLLVVETIANPLLRVANLGSLADMCHKRGARLLVDNTFASPVVCRPIEFGADLVWESLTKIMNGHSDVILGILCGSASDWRRVTDVQSTWGLAAAPFDSWLAARGLATLALRAEKASHNAMLAAQFLECRSEVAAVLYPGLPSHPDHQLAVRQFGNRFGSMVTFTLQGEANMAERFIRSCRRIPFCPSLGEISTTLSHPASTSHRGLSKTERDNVGILDTTIRLSVGVESSDEILDALAEGLIGLR